MLEKNLIPLEKLISPTNIPDSLMFLYEGLSNIFQEIYIAELKSQIGRFDKDVFYYYTLVAFKRIGLEIPGTDGMAILLNPGTMQNNRTEIPMSLSYSWEILKYKENFNVNNFDYSPLSVFDLMISIISEEKKDLLSGLIDFIYPPKEEEQDIEQSSVQRFINYLNQRLNPVTPLFFPLDMREPEIIEDLIRQLTSNGNTFDILEIISTILLDTDTQTAIQNINEFFRGLSGSLSFEKLKEMLIPHISASIEDIRLALEFPRNLLKPIDPQTQEIIEDENVKSQLLFDAGRLDFSSRKGFEFEGTSEFSFQKSQIGNTGLTLEFENAKLDLSRNSNISEADVDGRGNEFIGVYVKDAMIGLPSKWFRNDPNSNTTLQLGGHNLLIGTGGISGTIALETIQPGGVVGENDYLWMKIGNDNGFQIGFNRFDMTFNQNAITESNIRASVKIPKFTNPSTNAPLQVDFVGKLQEDGDFNLTTTIDGGLQASLFNFVHFDFKSLELGRKDGEFYLGASCDIWFENEVMTRILGNQRISLPNLRIHSDGSIELIGGNSFIPANVNLELGPVNMAVTGIHFGSYEQNGRKYSYWGFDGAMSVDPLGIDVRGEGLKYYYSIDDAPRDSFLRIQTLQVDLVIPGNSSADAAFAIIHGMLTIPEPGSSTEYKGEISLKLPKVKIAGGASMRLMPKEPAFLVDSYVDLPAPIPIGPVGIYGFRGLLGYRYVAEKEAVGLVSGEDTWYDYYKYPRRGINEGKFSGPNRTAGYNNPFSLGAGVVLGTSFDSGTIISVRAMMVLSLPTLFMLDGRASLLSARLGLDDTGEPPFFAFIAWGDSSIEMGMGADFQLPKNDGRIFSLHAQVESRFPFNNASGWYVNLGTRENPNTARVFKNILDLRAQAYLMLSSQGIQAGARADFELKKNFFGIKVRIYAFAEVGGKVSFERPQIGGYVYLGGGIDVNVWRLIYIGFDLSTYLSAEAVKPFLIHAELQFRGRIKITRFIRIPFSITLKLRWSVNNQLDTRPIPVLPYGSDELNDNRDRTEELVRGVHMMTNETFELNFLGRNLSSVNHNNIDQIIPLDTYIDIKSPKGLIGEAISDVIGGYTMPPSNYMELIPPQGITPDGRSIRQVKHTYSIEQMEIKAWTGNRWIDYHPYEALVPAGEQRQEAASYKKGYWQLSSKQYDTVRLMALTPFTYITPGEPGWFIPELHGITASTIFCQGQNPEWRVVDVLNKTLGSIYFYTPNSHYINGAYFRILQEENIHYPLDNRDVTVNTMQVTDEVNYHGFDKSLSFTNHNTLVITLPESAVDVQLKLSTRAREVNIRYYRVSPSQTQFELVSQVTKSQMDLEVPVLYNNPGQPVMRIEVEPLAPPMERISEIREEIASLFDESYESTEGLITIGEPSDPERYEELQEEMRRLVALSCYSIVEGCEGRIVKLCDLYWILMELDCFGPITDPRELRMDCYLKFYQTIKDYDYPDLLNLLSPYFFDYERTFFAELQDALNNGYSTDVILELYQRLWSYAIQILNELYTIGNCGCDRNLKCTTSFQEMRWMSLGDYEYTLLIPGSEARQEDQQAMRDAVENVGQPIWRPDTKYYIHFKLKDTVNDGNAPAGIYDYYYGFRTTGGVGHYSPDNQGNEEQSDFNTLARYIDYQRSYPNADGNLLQAKPLFWSYYECKLNIFFNKPFVHHMLKNWPEYNGLPSLQGAVNIKIKDPASDRLIPYPLPVELEEVVPSVHGNGPGESIWIDVNDPSMPAELQLINDMLASSDIPCQVHIGDLIIAGTAYSVKVKNLKPQKLYTASVYSAFRNNTDNVEIHNYVFQTSRYENFNAQVNSCMLTDGDVTRQALFNLSVSLDNNAVNNAYAIVSGSNLNVIPELSVKYSHPFDRVLEGVFLFKPLEYPVTTEFNMIRNTTTGDIIAVLVRNPEPFNDPKMPLEIVRDTIAVMNDLTVNPNFKVLYSKDYSQAIIMKSGNMINDAYLRIRFLYKLWNGTEYNIEDTVSITLNIN